MSKYLFVLVRGPEESSRVGHCLRLAKLAVLKGHEVSLYLMGEAVVLAQRYTKSCPEPVPSREADDPCRLFSFLRGSKARILVDKRSARERLHDPAALPRDLALASDAAMLDLAEESKVFSF